MHGESVRSTEVDTSTKLVAHTLCLLGGASLGLPGRRAYIAHMDIAGRTGTSTMDFTIVGLCCPLRCTAGQHHKMTNRCIERLAERGAESRDKRLAGTQLALAD